MNISFGKYMAIFLIFVVFGCATPGITTAKNPERVSAAVAATIPVAASPLSMQAQPAVGKSAASAEEAVRGQDAGPAGQPAKTDSGNGENSARVNGDENQNLLDTALEFCKTAQDFWAKGNVEMALNELDQAYALILQVDSEQNPKFFQQKEDLRFMISKRILEIYSSQHTTVIGTGNAIPLTFNKEVENEIKSFQGPERNFFIDSYRRSGRYRQAIVKAFKEAGLPEELSWLPLIESGFHARALSPARALGIWQFIPSTGYKYGLKRDAWIDERLVPEKATAAAIAYMKELHEMFGDWSTVLAAYNCGEANVLRVIREQQINYLDNFWDLYWKLPRETARYVPRFIATLLIVKNPEKYGFNLDGIYTPIPYETVAIEKPVELKVVASKLGVSLDDLTLLNPELRRHITPDTPYALKVPTGTASVLLARLDEIPKCALPQREAYVYHKVKRGETLSSIARKYRASTKEIIKANKLRKYKVLTGQKLKIPVKSGGPEEA